MPNTVRQVSFGVQMRALWRPDLQNNVVVSPELPAFIDQLEGYTLNATSTPPVTKWHIFAFQFVGTSATIDLTALDPGAAPVDDFTGLKVNAWAIKAGSANNAAGITVDGGATNPYELFGHANDQITLLPGMFLGVFGNAKLAAVSSTVKNIRFQGAVADWVYYALAAG